MKIALLPLLLLLPAAQKVVPKPALPASPAPLLKSVDGLPIGAIPRQALPTTGCAAYLWTAGGTRALVAMVRTDPAQLRLSIGGIVTDLARTSQIGASAFGFAGTTDYAGPGATVSLTMRVETRADLKGGAVVPEGVLRLDRTGQDSVVVPLAGIVGCAG